MRAFTFIKCIEKLSKSRMLTCEGEIVSYLIENGPSRPRDIVKNINHSQVSVFNKLKDLSVGGVVKKEVNYAKKISLYKINDEILLSVLNGNSFNEKM